MGEVAELKHLDLSKDEFEANGVKYYIKNSLTITRFIEYEKLQSDVGFGKSFQGIYNDLDTAIGLANKGKGVEAWNVLFNLKDGIAQKLENRMHPSLLLCSLFIISEGEDITIYDEKVMNKKIDDWVKEGFDVADFFQLAGNLVTGYIDVLSEVSQDISENQIGQELNIKGEPPKK